MSIYGHDCEYCHCQHDGQCVPELEAACSDLRTSLDTMRRALETIQSRALQALNGRKQGAGKSALAELDNIVKHCKAALKA